MTSLEATVSDYVAGRLDPGVARVVEALAHADLRVASAIAEAREVRRRVTGRLASSGGRG